ncbi:MAG: diversity-generating retroelement protein Avd, partial [Bryobacteraceae bacterium]
ASPLCASSVEVWSMTPSAVQKAYETALWLIPKANRFNRAYKFTVGDRIVTHTLDLVESLASAAYASGARRAALLEHASERLNGLRYVLRLAHDLQLLSAESYGHAAGLLEELGRMTGGWKRSGK